MKAINEFETCQPFATRFFRESLKQKHLVHAYILRSRDLFVAYKMALRVAQILNCSNKSSQDDVACGICQSCCWIEENAHPGVITLSNLTYLSDVDPETGVSKSRKGKAQQSISVDQMKNLLKELSLHSAGFHRIVILTGAKEISVREHAVQTDFIPPKDWIPSAEGMYFQLLPLDREFFPAQLANKFLKTLEEPPEDVLFFLLTDSEEKLLETIVSRCQSIPFNLPDQFYKIFIAEEDRIFFSSFLQKLPEKSLDQHISRFYDYLKSNGLQSVDLLNNLQQFLWEHIDTQKPSLQCFESVKQSIKKIEKAKTMIGDRVKEEAVLEDLFLYLANTTSL